MSNPLLWLPKRSAMRHRSEIQAVPSLLGEILERSIALPLRADVWLPPSKDEVGKEFLAKTTKRFRGSTTTAVRGSYQSREGEIEVETMWVTTVFAERERLKELGYFVAEAEKVARHLEQESLLFQIDVGQGAVRHLMFLK